MNTTMMMLIVRTTVVMKVEAVALIRYVAFNLERKQHIMSSKSISNNSGESEI